MLDIDKVRADTEGLRNKPLFFNSAGSSLVPTSVTKTMISYLQKEEQIGGYALATNEQEQILKFYDSTAKLIGAKANQIAFTTSASDAYNRALSSIPFEKGDCIITSDVDYVSNQLAFISMKKRYGVEYHRIGEDEKGDFLLKDLEAAIIKLKPKLVAINHIPTNSGKILPAEAIGDLCAKYDVLYLLDACQSIGQLPLDVKNLQCDFLTATGRKWLRGPRGTGFLFVSDKVLELGLCPVFADQNGVDWTAADALSPHKDASRFEQWEKSYASLLGLGAAIDYALELGVENIMKRNKILGDKMRAALKDLPQYKIEDLGSELCNIITISSTTDSIALVQEHLKNNNVFYSISGLQSALLDFTKRGIEQVIRFSPHYFNTEEEITRLIALLSDIK